MAPPSEPAALTELVDALFECAAPITMIIDDMAHRPDRPHPAVASRILRELTHDVLAPLAALMAPRDLRTATVVLEAAAPLMFRELPVGPPPARPAPPRHDPRATHRAPLRPRPRTRRGRE